MSWSKRHRTGLFCFSEITTLTRSMLSIRALGLRDDGDGVLPGDGVPVVQELALQPAADQLRVPHLKEDVAPAQGHGGQVLRVGADVLHLAQRGCRAPRRRTAAALDLLQRLPPQGQAEPVHRHHGEALVRDLEQGAGVDGAGSRWWTRPKAVSSIMARSDLLLDGDGEVGPPPPAAPGSPRRTGPGCRKSASPQARDGPPACRPRRRPPRRPASGG